MAKEEFVVRGRVVPEGTIGGFTDDISTLVNEHGGFPWIDGQGVVLSPTKLSGNTIVEGHSLVHGSVLIHDSIVTGYAHIVGVRTVIRNSTIEQRAKIIGNDTQINSSIISGAYRMRDGELTNEFVY